MTSPTQRTLALLRREGCVVAVVEKWNQHAQIRQDLFGWGDVLAIHPSLRRIVLVQTTTAANLPARIAKAKQLPGLLAWLRSGGYAEFHGWVNVVGKWRCKRLLVTEADIDIRQVVPRLRKSKSKQLGLFG